MTKLNQSYPIYGRILLQNIKTAIRLDKKQLILGRTANEYKSNFGAFPIKSFIFLKIKNNLLRTILKPIYSKIRLKKWINRRALKEEIKKITNYLSILYFTNAEIKRITARNTYSTNIITKLAIKVFTLFSPTLAVKQIG